MGEHFVGNIALRAFFLIFIAELGDKTQLMSMALACQYRKPVWVFIGAASALVIVTLIGVSCGSLISRVIPTQRIHQMAGAIFIIFGALMLFKRV